MSATKAQIAVVRLGLAQIPLRDLRRLEKWIDDGKPMLLGGGISDDRGRT